MVENGGNSVNRGQEDGSNTAKEADGPQTQIDFDYVLSTELGQFGRFQLRNVILLVIAIINMGAMFEFIFTMAATPHRCRVPECGEEGKRQGLNPEWLRNAIPSTESGFASCERYAPVDYGVNGSLDYCPVTLFDQSRTVACEGFVYGEHNTAVYEFDLGCKEWLRTLAGTLFNAGTLLTLPITGYISDRFGRKIALLVNMFNLSVFGIMRAFSINYPMYLTLQIVQSTLGTGSFSSAYILATELVGPKYRVLTGVTCNAMFTVGEAALGAVAWLISPWRYVIMAICIPCFFFVSYYWLITESIRWLLSKRKYTEAREILQMAARVNKTQISEKSLEALTTLSQAGANGNVQELGLLRRIIDSPILLRRVCTTPFWWITMTFVYYGLSINSTSLSDTMHLNYILTALVGIPAFYASIFVLNKVGRKTTLAFGYFLSAACNISFVFISKELTAVRLVIYLMGKFFIASVGTSLYLYTAELYPTEYRHTLLGFSSMIGRIGSISAPLTPALMVYYHGLPSLLFGGMAVLAGLLVLTQPETLGCKMPDTLAEAEAIGRTAEETTTP